MTDLRLTLSQWSSLNVWQAKKKVSISNVNRKVNFARVGNMHIASCIRSNVCVVFRHGSGPGGPKGDSEGG